MTEQILLLDDDASFLKMLEKGLRKEGRTLRSLSRGEAALELLRDEELDVILTDLRMPGLGGIEFCRRAREIRPDVPVVVVTAFGSLESAIEAIRAGAYDFVTKPIEMELLRIALDRAVEHRVLHRELRRLSERVAAEEGEGTIVGESPVMRRLSDQIRRVAGTDASVLVTGASGTGKELVARAIHDRGPRRRGPFVAVNCPALPATLLEGELFGHVRGAFTGADATKEGLLAQADGGTLFLDEIGDFPLELQPKLLRCLEERCFRPLGGKGERSFDARLVAATNQDLEKAVAEGNFREDLYYRLNVVQLHTPPLAARGMDVLLLAQRFLETFAGRHGKSVTGFSEAAAARLLDHPWPGNVRELRNAVERAVALTRHDRITPDDLPPALRTTPSKAMPSGDVAGGGPLHSLEEVERRHVLRVLEAVGGSRTEAARILGIDRKTLYRKLRDYGE